MSQVLPYLIIGLTDGSVYAIAALGLVLTYKTTGIFTFSHGATAAAAAYVFFEFWKRDHLPWGLAAFVVVFILAPLAGVAFERLARELERVSTAAKIVATVGLLVAIQGIIVVIFGSVAVDFPPFLPQGVHRFGTVHVGDDQVITVIIALASALVLFAFFRTTRTGTAMRAVVDNGELLDLTGISPTRVRVLSWVIGSSFAALSGLLIAPGIGLNITVLTLLVVQAFGAAAIGSFSSLPLTYVGGLVVGIGAGLATKYAGQVPVLSGLPPSFPFVVLFVVLVVMPKNRLTQAAAEPVPPVAARRAKANPRAGLGAVVIAVGLLAVAPELIGSRLPSYSDGLVFVLLFSSLALLVRTSGQVSLCHMAFAAVGASTFSHFVADGVPWALALVLSGLIAVPIGAVLAIPAIRLSRLYLALATFGFGILLERFVFTTSIMFGAAGELTARRPGFATGDKAYYYLILVVVLASLTILYVVTHSRLGRLLQAMSDSPTALSTFGINVSITRVIVFCIASFFAGLCGALLAGLTESASTVSFDYFESLLLLPVLYLAGRNELVAPFIAAFALAVAPSYFTGEWFTNYQPVIFGLAAVAAAVASSGRFDARRALSDMAGRRARLIRNGPLASRLPSRPALAGPPVEGR